MKSEQEMAEVEIDDPVFNQYGPPFFVNESNKTVLNARAVAIKCAIEHPIKYDTKLKRYERFDRKSGLWLVVDEVAVARQLDNLLVHLGETYEYEDFVKEITASKLNSLCKMLRAHNVRVGLASIWWTGDM